MSIQYIVEYKGKDIGNLPPLYTDDTIDTVKRKIIMAMNGDVPYDSIYLYGVKEMEFTPEYLYEVLTQGGNLDLTHQRLESFLSNFVEKKIMEERKDIYNASDLYALRLNEKHLVKFPIGIAATGNRRLQFYFPAVPDSSESRVEDSFLLKNAEKMISTQNAELLMDMGELHQNKLYLVLADDIFINASPEKTSYIIKVYYPFLEKAGINTRSEYDTKREKLIEQNSKFLSPSVLKSFESIDLFHEIAKESGVNPRNSGIKSIDFNLTQKREIVLPLENLFKVLHATREHPFVKFNPGMRQESLVRLFSDAQTITGQKIPFLSKSMIMRLVKSVSKYQSLGIYICENIVCTIIQNGSVQIICEFDDTISLEDVDQRIRILVNPVLSQVKKYVEHSGLQFDLFDGFKKDETRIDLNMLNFASSYILTKKINLKPIMSCVSSVFNVTQDNLTKEGGIQMRFKRVANYNEMDAIDAFMRNAINQTRGNVRESIIPMIRDNFNITQEEAEAKFIAFIGEEEVKLGMSENAKLRIRDNPGFKTTLEKEKFSSILNVSMDIQDNLEYLNVVPIYLNSLIQISQGKFSEKTKAVCTRKVEKKDEAIPEIVNPSELPFADNKTPVIEEGEELVFDDEGDDDMLDALLLGSDEDEEEDDDEGGQSEAGQSEAMQSEAGQSEPMVGGAPDDDELVADITGMALSNPNPFSKRMEDRDPALFLKKDQGKFKAYSRMCASNMRRQPVILTEEEKRRIDEEHPGSYSEVIKYGSDPKKPYYYICPRYWSIPENTSLSEEEVLARQQAPLKVGDEVKYKEGDDDKSGTVVEVEDTRIKIKNEDKSESWEPRENVLKDIIIPPDAKKVPKGKTIYEFTVKKGARAHSDFVDADGNYITHYPGFISGDKHPDGLCMPCCFKSWTANEQVRRRRECAQEEGEASSAQVKARREYTGPQKDYIKSHDKFPLEEERMGYLPLELQLFFQEDAKQYQVSELDPSLKDDAVTLLRYGVESSNNQSFIGCIAAVYADTTDEENKQRFIRQFKQVKKQQKQAKKDKTRQELVLQEKQLERKLKELGTPKIKEMREIIANLITIDNFTNFQNGNLVTEFYPGNVDGVSIDDYAGSNLYKQLDTSDEDQVFYFERLIAAYENFLAYLRNDDNEIAYQYLWDIVTMPNPDLFPSGINLVILEIPQDDATSNVNIICPTNHYSRQGFDTNKRTLMLVKKNEFYEPIYLYNNIKGEVSQFLFREQNLLGKPNIKLVLSKIRKYINESCRPLNSMPEKYKYRENIPLDKVVEILAKKEIEITALEVHYNGKAIGVHIKYPDGDEGFIPCYPSNYQVTNDLPIIFMDGKETKNRKNLEETVKFLRKTNRETGLPTKPMCKVEEENLIVGVITETNQLIMLDKPEELREADDQGENETLKICSVKPYEKASKAAISEKGVDTERVRFMNALKREKRNYTEFRNLVRVQLNKLGNIKIKNNILDEINREDKDSLESYQDTIEKIVIHLKTLVNGIVEFVERGKGVNVEEHKYPKKNSLTGADNEEFYYIRLADELLRFKRIQLFMLETNKYLSFSDIHYEINDDELLLLESMINNQFFQGLNAAYKRNTYVHFNTYDTAMPIKTVPYSEKIGVQTLCKIKARSALTEWEQKIVGDEGFSINEFNTASKEQRNTVCTYELIMSILENEKNRNEASKVHDLEDITYQAIKEILIEKYNGYDENKVLNRLYQEGKEQWVRAIRGGKMTLEQYIRSDQYAFTLLDLWMLADYFDIPILFFGQFKMNMNGTKSFATKHYKKGKAKHYYLIRLYKPVQNTYPRYGLVVDPRKSIYININKYTSLLNRFLLLFMDKFGKKTPPPLTIGEYIEN